MKTIILMTASGAENLGDELITLCEMQNFRAGNSEINIILFSHRPERTLRFLRSQNFAEKNLIILPYFPMNIRHTPFENISYFFKTLRAIHRSQHIYVGGGWLLYSASEEWHSPLKLWWMRAILAKIFKKPITYLSLWVSAGEKELQKYAKWIFGNTTITVRDKESQKILLSLGYVSDIKPDPVFDYKPKTEISKIQKKWPTIGIAVRSWFISDEILKNTIKILIQKGYIIYLLPHSLHPDDMKSHDGYYLQKFLLPGVNITQTIEQTLAMYSVCDTIIGMRLHSIILASVFHIPLLAISYSEKTTSILTTMRQSFLIPEEVTTETLLSHTEKLCHI